MFGMRDRVRIVVAATTSGPHRAKPIETANNG
jgi:hypothetical protein